MKNSELISLYEGLKSLNLSGIKLNFAIIKNVKLLEEELETLGKVFKADEKFDEFEKKRVELLNKYAAKKGDNFVVENNQIVLRDKEAFDKEFMSLKEEYSDSVALREKQITEYNELLQEDNDIQLEKIDLTWIPEDVKTKEMEVLYPLIKG